MQSERGTPLLKRVFRNRGAVFGGLFLIVLIAVAFLAPHTLPSPRALHLDRARVMQPPSLRYPMGTDAFGRDVLNRVLWGTRVSLQVGFVAAMISATLGTLIGAASGFLGGKADQILMRFVEVIMMIPRLFLVLLVVTLFGSNIRTLTLIIGLTIWPSTARLVRAEFLALREREFVEAAHSLGASRLRVALRHVLPNAVHVIIVNTSMQVAAAVLLEASISFLGLGDPSQVTWGQMLNDALKHTRAAWWLAVFPGLAITLSILSLNFVGDALNDALNPRLGRGRQPLAGV